MAAQEKPCCFTKDSNNVSSSSVHGPLPTFLEQSKLKTRSSAVSSTYFLQSSGDDIVEALPAVFVCPSRKLFSDLIPVFVITMSYACTSDAATEDGILVRLLDIPAVCNRISSRKIASSSEDQRLCAFDMLLKKAKNRNSRGCRI